MSKMLLRKTFGTRDDIILWDDMSVTVNGVKRPDAIVDKYEGSWRIALDSKNPKAIQVNAVPAIAEIRVYRLPGWQNKLGWRAQLIDRTKKASPKAIALAVYSKPEADGYLFTTGAFTYNASSHLWETNCPPGFEPGDKSVNFSMLYGSLVYSAFTLHEKQKEIIATIGGDL